MKKLLVFVGILSFISSFASAQDVFTNNSQDGLSRNKTTSQFGQFDISNYYTPDIIRNELELHFNFDSNFGKNNTKILNYADRLSSSSNNFGFENDSRISFKRVTNTRKRITYLGSGINLEAKRSDSESSRKYELEDKKMNSSYSAGDISFDFLGTTGTILILLFSFRIAWRENFRKNIT